MFNVPSRHCALWQFDKPTSAKILYAVRDGRLSAAPAVSLQQGQNEGWRNRRQTKAFPAHEPQSDGVLLKFPQVKPLPFLTVYDKLSLYVLDPAAGSWRPSLTQD